MILSVFFYLRYDAFYNCPKDCMIFMKIIFQVTLPTGRRQNIINIMAATAEREGFLVETKNLCFLKFFVIFEIN